MACTANAKEKKKSEEKKKKGRRRRQQVSPLPLSPCCCCLCVGDCPSLDSRRAPSPSPSLPVAPLYRNPRPAPFQAPLDYFTQVRFCCCLCFYQYTTHLPWYSVLFCTGALLHFNLANPQIRFGSPHCAQPPLLLPPPPHDPQDCLAMSSKFQLTGERGTKR